MKRALVGAAVLAMWAGLFGPLATTAARPAHASRAAPHPLQGPLAVGIGDATVAEGDAGAVDATFTISLSHSPSNTVVINFHTVDDTATTADGDYTATTGSVAFTPGGPTSLPAVVPVLGDTRDESDETFFVNITATIDIQYTDPQGVGTILDDDDGIECTYAISPTSASFPASGGTGAVSVTTDAACAWTATSNDAFITVTSGGSGSGPGVVDYAVAPNASTTARTGTITIAGLTFTLTQAGAGSPPVLAIDSVALTEGDAGTVAATFTVTLSAEVDTTVAVTYETADESATIADGDYQAAEGTVTFGPGQPLARQITVLVNGDSRDEPDEQFRVAIDNDGGIAMQPGVGHATILDDDAGACGYLAIPAVASFSPAAADGSFYLATGRDCEWTAASDAAFITVAEAGTPMTGSRTVRFTVAANPGTAARSGTITAGDAVFAVTQAGGPLPTVSINSVGVMEGDESWDSRGAREARFTVRLSEPVGYQVAVEYATRPGGRADGATGGGVDYVDTSGTVSFAPGETSKQLPLPVRVNGDLVGEDEETFSVDLSDPVNAVVGTREGVCTVYDDDVVLTWCTTGPTPIAAGSPNSPATTTTRLAFLRSFLASRVRVLQHVTLSESTYEVEELVDAPSGERQRATLRGTVGTSCERLDDVIPFPIAGNPEGIWTLTIRSFEQEGAIECWCVEARGAHRGILLTPQQATLLTFDRGELKATVIADGGPAAGVPLTFHVTQEGRPELTLTETVTTDETGVAEYAYTRRFAGTDKVRVEFADGPDVIVYAESDVDWVESPRCPTREVADVATVDAARGVRDGVLARTERGRRYTTLYYRFAGEAVRIMMLNPMLLVRSREILARYKPVIADLASGREVTLRRADLDEIEAFLAAFGDRSSPELREAIREACRDLWDPEVQSDLRFRVVN